MSDQLDNLQEKIREARLEGVGEAPPPTKTSPDRPEDMNQGVRAGTELVVSIVAGGLIGYGLDHWLETGPFCFIGFFILGIFTGFWNVYRVINGLGSQVGFAQLHNQKKPVKEAQPLPGTSEEDS